MDPSLPDLNERMTAKLRQLSIVALARNSKKVCYTQLQSEIGIYNVRELEDLIVSSSILAMRDDIVIFLENCC